MNSHRMALAGAFGALVAAGGCLSPVRSSSQGDTVQAAQDRRILAAAVVDHWQEVSALAARRLMEKYGPPDEVRHDHLVWNPAGLWSRTVVRDVLPPYAVVEDLGVIEQTVEHPLTPGQAADVAAIDGRLSYNARSGEITARSDREELNYLRINLANDVANRRMNVEQARDFYARVVALDRAGKSSPYLLSLRLGFEP